LTDILLDTCAVIWLATGSDRLSTSAREQIQRAGKAFVSAISGFEIAHAADKGKIDLPQPPADWYGNVLLRHALTEIPLTGAIAIEAVGLPRIHRDPCDRFIIATAVREKVPVVTGDRLFHRYGVTIIQ
jgi:PIN domain nuclease of toxin-antitoxin system